MESKKNDSLEKAVMRLFYSGKTPEETATIIINMGGKILPEHAITQAKEYGDKIIPAFKKVSKNFAELNDFNVFVVAEILADIRTPLSLQTCRELYTSEILLHQLVGAIGLAESGDVHDLEKGFRVPIETLYLAHENVDWETTDNFSYDREGIELLLQLAILALGKTRNAQALPYLSRILQMKAIRSTANTHHLHAHVCEAIQMIGNRQAIPVLQERLADPRFYAPASAFKALYSLNPYAAITIAIQRIQTGIIDKRFERWEKALGKSSEKRFQEVQQYIIGELIQALSAVTGENFHDNYEAWQTWWEQRQNAWKP